MHPIVKKIISGILFYGAIAAATFGLFYLYNTHIWVPQNQGHRPRR